VSFETGFQGHAKMLREPSHSFVQQLAELRSGNIAAINEFVATYEPFIRRAVRFRLARAALQPVADSVDVSQSVISSFLIRLSAGEYDIQSEENLRSLLVAIANKKFLMLNRREAAAKRSRQQTQSLNQCSPDAVQESNDPSEAMVYEELMREVDRRLTTSEQELLNRRRNGETWSSIALSLNENEPLLRKRLSRAIQRVSIELGLESSDV
jgi:DNA-directed RNA polymerase specialized sigma24 family protein